MDKNNFEYFCNTQSSLHSICIRVYKDESLSELIHFCGSKHNSSSTEVPINNFSSFKSNKSIAVFDEKQFLLGRIKIEETGNVILIGPVRMSESASSDVTYLIQKYKLPQILEANITRFLLSAPVMQFDRFLVILSALNLVANNTIVPIQQIMSSNRAVSEQFQSKDSYIETIDIEMPRASGDYEEAVAYYIKNGMIEEINNLNFENFRGQVGFLGPNQLRSIKNSLIILNSLCLRAAISGGLDTETAYTLGERYAQRIERSSSIAELGQISPMIRQDYCLRVKNLSVPKIENPHIYKATKYIHENIYTKITVSDLADFVGIEPEYLSALSRSNLGCTMAQYISKRKISEAKKLLRFTEKSLMEISTLLLFSSQSHFQRQFKKIRGITPSEYRKKYRKESSGESLLLSPTKK